MPAHQEVVTLDNKLSASARRLKDVIRNRLPLSEEGTRDVVSPAGDTAHPLLRFWFLDRLCEIYVVADV